MGTLTQKINLQATLVLFLFGPKETPKKQALALGFFDYSIHAVPFWNLKFRLKQDLKKLYKICPWAKKSASPSQRKDQGFLFLSHPISEELG